MGIEGLDEILCGGLRPHRLYLVEGIPGSGKTTLSLQFLRAGVRLGEAELYVTLSESKEECRRSLHRMVGRWKASTSATA
jgi:circadian clock protein KaiC